MEQLTEEDLAALAAFDLPVPRYTSYPPANTWQQNPSPEEVVTIFRQGRATGLRQPFSGYLHIPFCRSMCLFCGCNVILNRREDRADRYLDAVLQEAELYVAHCGSRPILHQFHVGGGTPTSLTLAQMERLFTGLQSILDWSEIREQAIEIDPRTIEEEGAAKLRLLAQLGFNRLSFGVQDSDARVQEAIRRRQSWACSQRTMELARSLGYEQINLDLIYGLPYQTPESFARTARDVVSVAPSRIALFSYAHVPWIKEHQRALPEEEIPQGRAKFELYRVAREIFLEAGYLSIGMDHFARPDDEFLIAAQQGTLMRNFQGYSIRYADHMFPLGVSAIGYLGPWYVQNEKDLSRYQSLIQKGILPYTRGHRRSEEDLMRGRLIEEIMCRFAVDLAAFGGEEWPVRFARELHALQPWIAEGWAQQTNSRICLTQRGRFVVRHIAHLFDVASPEQALQFSRGL